MARSADIRADGESIEQPNAARASESSGRPAAERNEGNATAATLSVVIPVIDRFDDVESTYWSYKRQLTATGLRFDVIYVLDGGRPDVLGVLKNLTTQGEPIKVVTLLKWFGEATAISIGAMRSTAKLILTLPAYLQIDPEEIPAFVNARGDFDMIVAARDRRQDAPINRLQAQVFHRLLSTLLQSKFSDLGCGVRLFKREIIEEIRIYADQHRFFPLLAERHGFSVGEVSLRQAAADTGRRIYAPGVYIRRFLDALAMYFLLKFTRKPFRFFGLIGLAITCLGLVLALVVTIERFAFGIPAADRPLLVIAALLGVLGVQTIAMGLIGEIIIFTRSEGAADYWIEKTVGKDE